jgi:metal-responsive CopG/Arc/MetJ family transcriptional regulator
MPKNFIKIHLVRGKILPRITVTLTKVDLEALDAYVEAQKKQYPDMNRSLVIQTLVREDQDIQGYRVKQLNKESSNGKTRQGSSGR